MCVLVAQSYPTLCDPMDCNPPGSSVHEIFQARILEWVAISFSRGSSQPRDRTWVSCTAGKFFTDWATSNLPGSRDLAFPYRFNQISEFKLFFFLKLLYSNGQSVQFSHSVTSDSLASHELQHSRFLCPPLYPLEFAQMHVLWVGDAI